MSPYEYRKLTSAERAEVVQERLARGFPPHSPPHPVRDRRHYLLSASCYEHRCVMRGDGRRQELLDALFEAFVMDGIEIAAWVVLPNHYHLLVHVESLSAVGRNVRFVHGNTAQWWNTEDRRPGRQVWYRYSDRAMRSEEHYYATLNYIHFNPVKHGWVPSAYDWGQSSVHWYLEQYGREWLRELWARYPLRSYGDRWDRMPAVPGDDGV